MNINVGNLLSFFLELLLYIKIFTRTFLYFWIGMDHDYYIDKTLQTEEVLDLVKIFLNHKFILQLINIASRHGDKDKYAMEVADYWLLVSRNIYIVYICFIMSICKLLGQYIMYIICYDNICLRFQGI